MQNSIVKKTFSGTRERAQKLSPEADTIPEGSGHSITVIKSRFGANNLSASEIHLSRDASRGINVHLDDKSLNKIKTQIGRDSTSIIIAWGHSISQARAD